MNVFKIGQRQITFDGEGEGNSGGGGGGAHPVEAPWSGADGVWTIGEGEQAANWFDAIPEQEARQHIAAKGYKNPAELALANYNLTKLQRGDPTVTVLPGDDATPEQLSEFYTKLGKPEAPEGYQFKFGEGVKPDDAMLDFARNTFHEADLTPRQAQIVADKWNEFASNTATQNENSFAEQNAQELTALEAKWGADLDKNKQAGKRVVEALGLGEDLMGKVESNIGTAALVELLATIGRKSDEGTFVGSGNAGDPNNPETMNPAQAQAKITELQGDAEFQKKYTDRNHPGHADALKLMERLFARV